MGPVPCLAKRGFEVQFDHADVLVHILLHNSADFVGHAIVCADFMPKSALSIIREEETLLEIINFPLRLPNSLSSIDRTFTGPNILSSLP
jgi:hypothetical protein